MRVIPPVRRLCLDIILQKESYLNSTRIRKYSSDAGLSRLVFKMWHWSVHNFSPMYNFKLVSVHSYLIYLSLSFVHNPVTCAIRGLVSTDYTQKTFFYCSSLDPFTACSRINEFVAVGGLSLSDRSPVTEAPSGVGVPVWAPFIRSALSCGES